MGNPNLKQTTAYKNLKRLSETIRSRKLSLKHLVTEKDRFENFSLSSDQFAYDFSKQRITGTVFSELLALAKATRAKEQFHDMVVGKRINFSEKRAALHTAARQFFQDPEIPVDPEVLSRIAHVNNEIEQFCQAVHAHNITGETQKRFTDAVIVGIGGSYLGTEFVYTALKQSIRPKLALHFLSNVDIDQFGRVTGSILPETTLWVIVSKSFTTTETMANLAQIRLFLDRYNLSPEKHLVTITALGSPGDDPAKPVLNTFHMFDFIGGRYSVSSAVGGLPLSLAFGFNTFKRFLNGCHEMDRHALLAPENENMPLISALISIWNSNFLSYPAQGIIPYCNALSKLAPHVQQLYMESLGKSVTRDGDPVDYQTGVIVFGEPGTNAQHSFFQLAHQGTPFPIDFIGVINPAFTGEQAMSKGVTNHQELWANMIAQARALAIGKEDENKTKFCEGNRPSSTVIINDLSPESTGRLLAFYEARTIYEGFVLCLNPFDQFGVELGKIMAATIREEIAQKNRDAGYKFTTPDPATKFYLDLLFKKHL